MTHRYVIIGAQGFVGRYLVAFLLNRFPDLTVLGMGRSPRDDLHFLHSLTCAGNQVRAPLPEDLHIGCSSRYRYRPVDLVTDDVTDEIREFRPTAVIHLAAALRGVADEFILRNNMQSTASMLNAVSASGIRLQMFLLASSGGVYGNQLNQPIGEDAPIAPLDRYSQSKLASENLVRDFAHNSGTPIAIARIFNVLGPGQDDLHVAGRFASQIGTIVAHGSPPIIRTGHLDSTRDFLDVRDVCAALSVILEHGREGVYNAASGAETRISELLTFFTRAEGLEGTVRIQPDTSKADSIPHHVANTRRIASLGFKPACSLAVSCAEMLRYHRRFIHCRCSR